MSKVIVYTDSDEWYPVWSAQKAGLDSHIRKRRGTGFPGSIRSRPFSERSWST